MVDQPVDGGHGGGFVGEHLVPFCATIRRFSSSDQKRRVRRATAKSPPLVSTTRWWTPSTSRPSHRKLRLRRAPPQDRSGRTLTFQLRDSVFTHDRSSLSWVVEAPAGANGRRFPLLQQSFLPIKYPR